MCHGHSTQDELDCKKVGVFLQIGLKETKSNVRDSRTRSARASHALRACEAREKKNWLSIFHEFVLTIGLKNVVELSKIYSQLRPLCKFDTPGDWFRESQRVLLFLHLASNLLEDQIWVEVAVRRQKPVPAPRRGREPSWELQIIVECAAAVSKRSSAILTVILRVDG